MNIDDDKNIFKLQTSKIFSGDLLGKFLAFMSLAPFGIGAGFVTLILFRRDLHTVSINNCKTHYYFFNISNLENKYDLRILFLISLLQQAAIFFYYIYRLCSSLELL